MNDKPFLTVVMPIHEGAEWVSATLNSLIGQASEGLEIVAIDSSPTTATADIIEQYAGRLPIRIIDRRDLGPWPAKTNLGVELAAADYVCILHQDDLWLPGRANAARRWLAKWPDAALHLAPTRIVDRNARNVGTWNCPLPADKVLGTEFLLERLLVQNFISVPAPVFRQDVWLASGGMDETLWYTADWDIWAKFAAAGPVLYHNEVTTAFRVHSSSLTVTGSRNADDFRSQLQVVLDRHLGRIPPERRRAIERVALASVEVNVSLAAASGGSFNALAGTALKVLSLGPLGIGRYLRDSRLHERVSSRLRAKLTGSF